MLIQIVNRMGPLRWRGAGSRFKRAAVVRALGATDAKTQTAASVDAAVGGEKKIGEGEEEKGGDRLARASPSVQAARSGPPVQASSEPDCALRSVTPLAP
jgi:hypothetical protein